MNKRVLISAIALALVQIALILLYARVLERDGGSKPATFRGEVLRGREPASEAIEIERRDRTQTTLGAYGGRWVLLHFWATWCAPCIEELPEVVELGEDLARDGRTAVLLVSVDEEWAPVERFLEQFPVKNAPGVEIVRDPKRGLEHAFGVSLLPDTYLLDPERRPRARYAGANAFGSEAARRRIEEDRARPEEPRPSESSKQ